jgi:hypothetical protein
VGGGNPMATDGRNVFHALALRFVLQGGEEWRMAMDHTQIFVVSNPRRCRPVSPTAPITALMPFVLSMPRDTQGKGTRLQIANSRSLKSLGISALWQTPQGEQRRTR